MEVAKVIQKQFPDNDVEEIEEIVKRYRNADVWMDNTTITLEQYENLENLLVNNDLLDKFVDFDKLVINYND